MPQQHRTDIDLSLRGLIHLNALWFGLAYLWNGLHIILVPALLIGLVPEDLKNTYLGALTFAGLFLAMLTQPVAGAVSDNSGWFGRFGKRRPWIVLGTLSALLLLAMMVGAQRFRWVLVAYIGLQLVSSFAEAALQSLLPDLVPLEKRGRASGYKNAVQIAGFVIGVALGGWLAGRGHIDTALIVTALILALSAGWTVFGVRESPVAARKRRSRAILPLLRHVLVNSFRFDRRKAPGYGRLLAGRGFLMAGFFALQGFAQYFVADVLRVNNPAGITALLMAVMGAAIFVLAVPTGVLADRIGRKPLNLLAGVLGAVATLGLVFVGELWQLTIAGGLIGASAGIFISANWAWAADLVPPDEAGRYMGLGNVAVAGAGALARLLGGPIVDAGNVLQIGLGYHLLFLVLAASMSVGTWLLLAVPETQPSDENLVEVLVPRDRPD